MYICVDVETDGEYPPDYSMVCFGAVVVDDKLDKTFYGAIKPISGLWKPEALAISGISREQHLQFESPEVVMYKFADWISSVSKSKPVLISDNNGFDASWINYYFHKFYGKNPFGFSSRRIGDLYCGLMKNAGVNSEWKRKYRKTKHTHDPVQDCLGNAEAILSFQKELGLKINLT